MKNKFNFFSVLRKSDFRKVFCASALLALTVACSNDKKTEDNPVVDSTSAPAADTISADTASSEMMIDTSSVGMNVLTEEEKKNGWKLLFDGKTSTGWRGAYKETFPDSGWVIQNGMLSHLKSKGGESNSGGDIITIDKYDNFEFMVDFNIEKGGNSGIKYFVLEIQPKPEGSAKGLEFQILDDVNHPDAKKGMNGNRTIGSLYDLIAASADKKPNPPGQWNTARLVSNGKHIEHWLNGTKVVEYERGSPEYRKLVAGSKYKDIPNFGEAPNGHLLLQDHGDRVYFRNIKIKVLPKK